ncbi:MAG: anthranilate phosphoribosyltransferase [Candidatus Margulisbacteria bacterium]|nr:anthranilate phosphoribosyltransferase [Candidatus Margulisiibacteriota bacterium]
MNIREALQQVVEKKSLTENDAFEVMNQMMSGEATPAQIGAFITALRMKGETIEEITGMAKSMRKFAHNITPKHEHLVDTCGTGGDHSGTFNVSNTAAFIAAGAGVAIAKHGNRSVTSKSGSADVLEALGVKIDLQPKQVENCINEVGIGFMFAPIFHGAMKHAIGPRKEIGIRTVFNILGPLTNPANATGHLLGVFSKDIVDIMAKVLKNLGVKHAYIVNGHDSIDEISITGPTNVALIKDNQIIKDIISPEKLGLKKAASKDEIKGYDAKKNAELILDILGNKKIGPYTDISILNAAAVIVAGNKTASLEKGVELAKKSITSGAALEKLNALVNFTHKC